MTLRPSDRRILIDPYDGGSFVAEHRFELRADNGCLLMRSLNYTTKRARDRGMRTIAAALKIDISE